MPRSTTPYGQKYAHVNLHMLKEATKKTDSNQEGICCYAIAILSCAVVCPD